MASEKLSAPLQVMLLLLLFGEPSSGLSAGSGAMQLSVRYAVNTAHLRLKVGPFAAVDSSASAAYPDSRPGIRFFRPESRFMEPASPFPNRNSNNQRSSVRSATTSVARKSDSSKPLLLYLPGIDGTGMSGKTQWPRLSHDFDIWCLGLSPEDRSSHVQLITSVEEFVVEQTGLEQQNSASDGDRMSRAPADTKDKRQVLLLGESAGTQPLLKATCASLDGPRCLSAVPRRSLALCKPTAIGFA
eukprot:6189068-Pleurochrysis_carterae.AAC.1